jgi:hypothetical protein
MPRRKRFVIGMTKTYMGEIAYIYSGRNENVYMSGERVLVAAAHMHILKNTGFDR